MYPSHVPGHTHTHAHYKGTLVTTREGPKACHRGTHTHTHTHTHTQKNTHTQKVVDIRVCSCPQPFFFNTCFFLKKRTKNKQFLFVFPGKENTGKAISVTPLSLLCPRQTPCDQHPPLLRCSTRLVPRTLSEAHTSTRSSVF